MRNKFDDIQTSIETSIAYKLCWLASSGAKKLTDDNRSWVESSSTGVKIYTAVPILCSVWQNILLQQNRSR